MAYFYGNTISSHWRAYGLYTVSETATSVTITLHGGFQSLEWGYDLSGVTCTITNNGTSKSGTGSVSTGTGSTSNVRLVSDNKVTVAKGTSAKTVTLGVTINRSSTSYHAGTSTGSTTVTIPALASYAVTYNANGHGTAPSSQTKYYGTALTLRGAISATGYTFKGWNTKANGTGTTYAASSSYTGNATLALYAIWQAVTYAVTYNANGGSGAPASQTKTYGTSLTLSSATPTRAGYNFLGWSTSSTATTATYQPGATYSTNAALALYAVWALAYDPPTISSLVVVRNDGSVDAEDGTRMRVAFSWAVDSTDSGEVSSVTVKYRERGTAAWSTATVPASGTSGTANAILSATFSVSTTYDVQVVVTDSHGASAAKTTLLSPAAFTLDFLQGGQGMSVGKACDSAGFHVGWDADFDGTVEIAGNLTEDGSIVLATNNSQILGTDTEVSGSGRANLAQLNGNGNIILGSTANSGATRVYGNNVDVVTSGKFRMGTSAPIEYEDKTVTVTSTAKGSNFMTSASVAKTGYTTLGVVGWWWDSGTRQNYFNAWGVFTSGNTLYVRLCNLHTSDAASGTLKVRVLYARSEMT